MNTEGCPLELFDRYIEVGEVKESNVKSNDCVFIEVWISSCFSDENNLRPECKKPERRPIYDVFLQIKRLCAGKKVCLVFMCDQNGHDTLMWAYSISLLIEQLNKHNMLMHTIIYTKSSKQDLDRIGDTVTRRVYKGREMFDRLIEMADVLVFEQANCYLETSSPQIKFGATQISPLLNYYIDSLKR